MEGNEGTPILAVTQVLGPYCYIDTHDYYENRVALLYLKRRSITPSNCQALDRGTAIRIWFTDPVLEQEGNRVPAA